MKKISLTVLGLYIGILAAFSQDPNGDSGVYKSRALKIDEVNFVSSYYHQEGNHSAVTGGIGTEKLTDYANSIELKMSHYDFKNRKRSIGIEAGIDYYTSASSDNINPKNLSSASSSDIRVYPSVSYGIENEKKGTLVGFNASYSHEFDYTSIGVGVSFNKTSKNKNREFGVKANAYFDQVSIIKPIEFAPPNAETGASRGDDYRYPTSPRNSFNLGFSLSQVVNKKFQLAFLMDMAYQQGFLSLPFHRVYFSNGLKGLDVLPDTRFKVPLALRASYFIGDKIIVRAYYRYYQDSWGLKAHTANIETPIKITPFVSVSPFYRFYMQSAIDYFAPYKQNDANSIYHTSDYNLSKFSSNFFGMGIRFSPPKGVLGIEYLNMLELRFGHYTRSNDLQSNIVSVNLRFK